MRNLVRALAPTEFEDVAALNALYRPGPMAANMHNDYADRKNGRKPVTYQHPDMEEVLGDTYGLCVYQEQMMLLAQKFAGYSLAEADNLRKAAGKKVRADHGPGAGKVRGRLRGHRLRAGHRQDAVRHHRAVRRLRLQPQPRLRLRPRQLPDGLAEGPLPGRVPGRPADQRQGRQGQDRGLPGRVPGPGHRGARPRRQRVALGVHRRRRSAGAGRSGGGGRCGPDGHPLRPVGHPQRRRGPGGADHRRAGIGAARSPTSTTSVPGSTRWSSTSARSSRSSRPARSTPSAIPARACAWSSSRSWTGPWPAGGRPTRGS